MKKLNLFKSFFYPVMFFSLMFLVQACDGGTSTHRWAWGDQQVDNHGGDSHLNVWAPNSSPGVFSLSQHWYTGGSGNSLQTVEGGWQVFPNKYGTNSPALFVYYTPDNYASGTYNLDKAGFIQVNNSWVLGGALAPVSTDGGTQYFIRIQWQLYEGNWWLFVQGSGDYIAVGYYPGSVFKSGQMARNAQWIKYGGETASNNSGDAGEMGSGSFADQGWTHSAYHRTIYYIDNSHVSQWADLDAHQPTSSCYTIDMHNNAAGTWATYFFYGGPGCP